MTMRNALGSCKAEEKRLSFPGPVGEKVAYAARNRSSQAWAPISLVLCALGESVGLLSPKTNNSMELRGNKARGKKRGVAKQGES